MRIVDHEEFLSLPEGTPFSFGPVFAFGGLMIKEESIYGKGFWGFWAMDPCGIESQDSGEDIDRLQQMRDSGASYPIDTSVSKYMSYDGDDFECFLVFEEEDIKRLKEILGNGAWE